MFEMLFPWWGWVKLGGAALLGAGLAFGPVYFYGKYTGRQQAAVAALETSVKVLKQRGEIDGQVSLADATALCSDYGLSDLDKAECVRRVREASAKP